MADFTTLDEAAFRASAVNPAGPCATSAQFDRRRRRLLLQLDSGLDLAFDPRRIPGLESATDDDLAEIEIEGIGGTLHLPRLDADYDVARVIELFLQPGATGRSAA